MAYRDKLAQALIEKKLLGGTVVSEATKDKTLSSAEILQFHNACSAIWDNRETKALNYAANYARAGLSMDDSEEILVQCLYILNNITAWRGDVATHVRGTLKQLTAKSKVREDVVSEAPLLGTNMSKEARARDTEESDREYIQQKQAKKAAAANKFNTYHNTPTNAKKFGFTTDYVDPEHLVGDKNAKYVTHDHVKGKFVFHNDASKLTKESVFTAAERKILEAIVDEYEKKAAIDSTAAAVIAGKTSAPSVQPEANKKGFAVSQKKESGLDEEVEPVDEVSKALLGRYIDKAKQSNKTSTNKINNLERQSDRKDGKGFSTSPESQERTKESDKLFNARQKRTGNIALAKAKTNKSGTSSYDKYQSNPSGSFTVNKVTQKPKVRATEEVKPVSTNKLAEALMTKKLVSENSVEFAITEKFSKLRDRIRENNGPYVSIVGTGSKSVLNLTHPMGSASVVFENNLLVHQKSSGLLGTEKARLTLEQHLSEVNEKKE